MVGNYGYGKFYALATRAWPIMLLFWPIILLDYSQKSCILPIILIVLHIIITRTTSASVCSIIDSYTNIVFQWRFLPMYSVSECSRENTLSVKITFLWCELHRLLTTFAIPHQIVPFVKHCLSVVKANFPRAKRIAYYSKLAKPYCQPYCRRVLQESLIRWKATTSGLHGPW
jgi:hypothetical protein